MTDVRYSVPGVPPVAANGITAFTPHFNRAAASGAQQYKNLVRGYPGTRAIPVTPHAQGVPPSPDVGDLAQAGSARSSDAPDAFWPNQYYQQAASETPGGTAPRPAVYSPQHPGRTSLLPVPAEDGRAAYLRDQAMLSRPGPLNRTRAQLWPPRIYTVP